MSEKIGWALLALPFYALVGGMFAEGIIMMVVNAKRRRTGYFETGREWSSAWKRLFPPPPRECDPHPLRLAYKIANIFVIAGLVGIGSMVGLMVVLFVFTKGR